MILEVVVVGMSYVGWTVLFGFFTYAAGKSNSLLNFKSPCGFLGTTEFPSEDVDHATSCFTL